MNFIGTHGLKGQTFIDMLCQVIEGYIRYGFKRIVVLNGHMENSNLIYDAAYQAMENKTDVKKEPIRFLTGVPALLGMSYKAHI